MPRIFSLLISAVLLSGCVPNLGPRICVSGKSNCPPGICSQPADTGVTVPGQWCNADSAAAHTPSLDIHEAALMMRLCWLAYACDDSIRALGSVNIDSIDCGFLPRIRGNKCFVWYDTLGASKRQVVAVRGTANFENMYQDIDYLKTWDTACAGYVGKGISDAVQKLEPIVRSRLVPGIRVYITGHSLGGAVAVLLGLHLFKSAVPIGTLYNFGQPKVLTEPIVLANRCFPVIRFINEDDPVPYVPPTMEAPNNPGDSLHPGYHGTFRHLGDEVVMHANGGYVYRCTHDQYQNGYLYAKYIWQNIKAKDYKKLIPAHLQDVYLARMKALVQGNP